MRAAVLVPILLAGGCPVEPDDDPSTDTDRTVEAFPRCADVDPLRQPFFGDTHVHTARSLDANLQGTRLVPDEAYRFAKGEEVGLKPYDQQGRPQRTLTLDRPLDWALVSDHAEFLGALDLCTDPGLEAYDHPHCVDVRDDPDGAYVSLNGTTSAEQGNAVWPLLCGDDGGLCRDAGLDVWSELQEAAAAHYDRTDACTFTTFVGYEWSGGPGARNLHRNVIFRHDVVPDLPVSYFDEDFEQGLWEALERDCLDEPPCDVLAIPHNSNLSSGLMFRAPGDGKLPLEKELAELQARMEPLVEVYQHKGDSECWPGSPVADDLCDFEKLPYNNLAGARLGLNGEPQPRDFVRDTLGAGLQYGRDLGVNPYRFGIVASTDTHLGTPGAASEEGFPGHGGAGQDNRDELLPGPLDDVAFSPGGLAVVWAEENSREAIFRAMRRGEAYGTSGPRIVLRLFGGADVDPGLCDADDRIAKADEAGVPMGGDLPAGGPPTFLVSAQADPDGHTLQRAQVVKGWLDGDTFRVAVHDVAGRADNGATVDTSTCEATGGGSGTLCGTWTDDDFDPDTPAFWYVRVVEDPTCRWVTRQCVDAGITCPTDDGDWAACCDGSSPATVQERAWSSPIWWTPEAGG